MPEPDIDVMNTYSQALNAKTHEEAKRVLSAIPIVDPALAAHQLQTALDEKPSERELVMLESGIDMLLSKARDGRSFCYRPSLLNPGDLSVLAYLLANWKAAKSRFT